MIFIYRTLDAMPHDVKRRMAIEFSVPHAMDSSIKHETYNTCQERAMACMITN